MLNGREDALSEMRLHAFQLEESTNWNVPEPFVKQYLASLGVPVPRGVVVEEGSLPSEAAQDLREPYALKGWGPGLIHKSEFGAVRVGVSRALLDDTATDLLRTVADRGVPTCRLYVEEMAPAGTELLLGMITRDPVGTLAIIGLGGTDAELLSDVAVRLCPLSPEAAEDMVNSFRGSELLSGYRGAPAVDRQALTDLLIALAGEFGLLSHLGDSIAEFECNPLFVSEHGAIAADARLVLKNEARKKARRPFPGEALFAPRSVAIVGGSPNRETGGNKDIAAYKALGWTDNIYCVHPSGQSIDGVPGFKSLGDIPGGVDYAMITIAGKKNIDLLRGANGSVRVATINAAGFKEIGSRGQSLQDDLVDAAVEGGVRFLGPNCMGFYSPRGRQTFRGAVTPEAGHIGAVLQSGGLAIDVMNLGAKSGLRFSAVASIGNAADVGIGELVSYMLDDPDTRTIAVHIEGGADVELVEALKSASGRKPVVLLLPGMSGPGAKVVVSHTGALTTDHQAWEALSAATGTTLTYSLEDFLAALLYLDRYLDMDVDDEDSVLIVGGGSGGAVVLAADECHAAGLTVPVLPVELQKKLVELNPNPGAIRTNPIDAMFTGTLLDLVLETQQFSDALIGVNVAELYAVPHAPHPDGLDSFAESLDSLKGSDRNRTRIAFVARNLTAAPGQDIDAMYKLAIAAGLPMFERFSDAATGIAAAKRFTHQRALVGETGSS